MAFVRGSANKRLVVGLVVLIGVAAVAGVLWFTVWRTTPDGAEPTATPTMSEADATAIERALADQDPERVATVLSPEAAAAYREEPAPVVPTGATVTIDRSTFTVTDERNAVVAASVDDGGAVSDVVLLLTLEDDEWRVLTSVTA